MPREYDTPEYKRARRDLLASSPDCHWCGAPATEADHLIEQDAGGDHTTMVPSCKPCNSRRGAQYVNRKTANRMQARRVAMTKNKTDFFSTPNSPRAPLFVLSEPVRSELAGTGHDQPRLETPAPDMAGTYGDAVGAWAKEHMDIEFMPWQIHVLRGQLAHDENGDLLHRVSLVSTARQNGKSTALAALVGWWLTEMPKIRGEKQMVLTCANRLDLSVTLFDLLSDILEVRFGAKLVKAYGRNSAQMPDGSRWIIRAAKPNVGHGTSNDLIIADEIWDISSEAVDGGLLPSQRARRSPMLSMWSTAGTESSSVMLRWREQGLRAIDQGKPGSFYFAEWSPDPSLDVNLESTWAWGNPALGITITPETLRAESMNPNRAQFLRAACNLWVASDQGWLAPGIWPSIEYAGDIPDGGYVAIEVSLDDSRYFGTRCVKLEDRRVLATVAFVTDTYQEMLAEADKFAPTCKFLISPSIDVHWPIKHEAKKQVVGYGEIQRWTGIVRNMIGEKLLVHDGSRQLAEHVQRAVAVKSEGNLALSSQRSPGDISLARCMVWAAAMAAKQQDGKPMIVMASR